MITEEYRQGPFYRLKHYVPSPENWCVNQNMEGLEYLIVESACEVNERGAR